jgi:hypothetical protein
LDSAADAALADDAAPLDSASRAHGMNGHSHGHAEHLNPRQPAPDLDRAKAQAEALKEQLAALDAKRERMLKSRPSVPSRCPAAQAPLQCV